MRYYYTEQIKENEVDEADIMNVGDRNVYQILKLIWKKQGERLWTGFLWFRTGTTNKFL
jgi:hypothetical protein